MGTVRRVDESVLELVRNLMARAESTTSENEARMCRERADRLIFKHAIDTSTLDRDGKPTSRMGTVSLRSSGVYKVELHRGKMRVANAYETVFVLQSKGRRAHSVFLYGEQGDVELLELVLNSLEAQAMAGVRAWWKRYNTPEVSWWSQSEQVRARRSWVSSFFQGVVSQVKAARCEVVEATGAGELMVVKQNRGQAYAAELIGSWSKGRKDAPTSVYHVPDGYEAGLKASLVAGGVGSGDETVQVGA